MPKKKIEETPKAKTAAKKAEHTDAAGLRAEWDAHFADPNSNAVDRAKLQNRATAIGLTLS